MSSTNEAFNSRAARLLSFGVLVALAACVTAARVGGAVRGAGVTWLIFVDDLHIDFRNTGYIRKLLGSIATDLIRDGDGFVLRSSGPSPSVPFATNRSLLDAAIGRVAGNALRPEDILRSSSPNGIQHEVRYRASFAGSAAAELLNAGASLGRRQAMLYITNGYPVDPLDTRIAGFAGAAQRAHVIVFAMNARGLPGAPAVPVQGDAALWDSYRSAMLNSLRAISEPTGGFAVVDEADFAGALLRISRSAR